MVCLLTERIAWYSSAARPQSASPDKIGSNNCQHTVLDTGEIGHSAAAQNLPLTVLLLLNDVVQLRIDLFQVLVERLGPLHQSAHMCYQE